MPFPQPAPRAKPAPEVQLAEVQLARRLVLLVAVILLVGLALSRLSWARTEAGLTALLFILTGANLAAAVWSVFVRRWATFAGTWLLGALALSVGGLLALGALDGWTLSRLGEASLYLLFPAGYGLLGFLLGGLVWAVVRRRPAP